MLERQLHVVAHAEVAVDAEVLELDADPHVGAAVRLGARDVAPAKGDGALVRLDAAEQELEEGALAGAVGADDAPQRAGLQREIHAVHRAHAAERLGEALGAQQGAVAIPCVRGRHAAALRARRRLSAWKRATAPVIAPSGSSIMTRIRIAPWTTSA